MTNLCRHAVASDFWAVAAATDETLSAALRRASVVIVESGELPATPFPYSSSPPPPPLLGHRDPHRAPLTP